VKAGRAHWMTTLPARRTFWPLLVLCLLIVFNLIFTPGFGSIEVRDGRLYGSLIDILHRGAPVMLLAIGMTLVISTAGVDLSVGAVMAVAGAVAAVLLTGTGLGVVPVVLLALGVGCLAGLWNGLLVGVARVQPIVATLVLMVAGRGLAQLLTGGQIVTFDAPAFEVLGTGAALGLPCTVLMVALVAVLTILLTRGTVAGLCIESTGANERAARLCGVSVGAVRLLVYAFSGLCAALAGLIVTADIKAADANNCGLYLELDAILAVVIGGTSLSGGRFNLLGSLVGALVMQSVTTTILTRGVGIQWTLVVKGVIVFALLLIQSPLFRRALVPTRAAEGAA